MISKLTINNFKNINHLELDLTQNFELYAPNGYGKSSIADAITWLFTGKLLSGSSDIMTIKPKDDTSRLVEVEALLEDGTSLKKTYQEKWTKTRGTTEVTLTSHETKCFINGLPEQVSKFDEALLEHFGINFQGKWKGNILQLLMDPLFFGTKQEWQDRRKLVIDLVGDVTDSDVFIAKPELRGLKDWLVKGKGKTEDTKKIINNALKDLKAQENKLNAQIEVLEQVHTISPKQFAEAKTAINQINAQIDDLKAKKYQSEEGAIAERNRQLADLKAHATESYQKDMEAYNKSFADRQKELEMLRTERNQVQREVSNRDKEINELQDMLEEKSREQERLGSRNDDLIEKQKELRNDWQRINGESFHTTDHQNCPNCGFILNSEVIKEQENKFNFVKANRLKEINEKGQAYGQEIKLNEQRLGELEIEIKSLVGKLDALIKKQVSVKERLNEVQSKETELSKSIPPFEVSQSTLDLKAKYEALKGKPITKQDNYSEEIESLRTSLNEPQTVIDTYNAEQLTMKRAKDLQVQLDATIEEIAQLEQIGAMLTEFIKVKLELLHDRVATVFGDIKFQLVESNIKEGSWNEVCWVMDGDVPYHLTNSASKIRLGLRVCEAIRKALGVKGIPYIIDNAEQITDRQFNLITDEQTIAFVAKDPNEEAADDPKLYVDDVLFQLEERVQHMREEGETDLRSVLHAIRSIR